MSVRNARSKLSTQLGREPTLSELAQDTGLSPEEIASAETAAEPVISLQAETGDGGLTLEGLLTAGGEEEGLVERLTLRTALSTLPGAAAAVLPRNDPGSDGAGVGRVSGPGIPVGASGAGPPTSGIGPIKRKNDPGPKAWVIF